MEESTLRHTHGHLDRREFIRASALTGAALAGGSGLAAQEAARPKLPRRKLGQTDLQVSVVGYGTEFMNDPGLVEHLIAEGVNNLDTAVLYQGGNAERQLAPILAKYRDDIVIATKFMRTIPVDAPKDAFIEDFNGSCERMETDSVDIIYLHDRRTPESVNSAGAKEAFEELRAAGRVKHFAMSTHLNQPACVQAGLDLGWFDVMLVHHNFLSPNPNADALKAADDAGVGVMAMKTCKPLSAGEDWYPRATDEQKAVLGEANLFQASIKWALSQDYITATILCMANYEEAEQDLTAAREAMTREEARALGAFQALASASVCRGCGTCDGACPQGIAVSDILRFRTYCEGYGEPTAATAHYRSLPVDRTVAACTDCGSCEAACPYGLSVRRELRRAHGLMA